MQAKADKKPASGGQPAMHERQKKCGAEWKEAKAAGKVEKGMTWPKFGALAISVLRRPADRVALRRRASDPKAEGVGESLCLADALWCHPVPGRRRAPLALALLAAAGPYDAIFNTTMCEDRDVA